MRVPFDRDKEKEKIRWKAFFEQRGRSTMTEEPHTEIGCAKQAWPNALLAVGDDPARILVKPRKTIVGH